MKKIVVIFSLFASCAFKAQDLTSKLQEPILPDSGDWAIGIDATRLIRNFSFDFATGSQAIYGKYFKRRDLAYRGAVRLGFTSRTAKNRVTDRLAALTNTTSAFPAPIATKENTWMRNSAVVALSGGIEKRRGKTRLQGLYGIEGNLFLSFSNDKFTYGNKLNPSNATPVNVTTGDAMSSTSLGNAANVDSVPQIQGVLGYARVTTRRSGLTLGIGARAFIGAEYFFAPKVSIGGEFGWGIGFANTGRSETVYESIGQSAVSSSGPTVKQTTIDGSPTSFFFLDNDNGAVFGGASASLRLMVHF
jgi:hypothetical protein